MVGQARCVVPQSESEDRVTITSQSKVAHACHSTCGISAPIHPLPKSKPEAMPIDRVVMITGDGLTSRLIALPRADERLFASVPPITTSIPDQAPEGNRLWEK